MWISVQGEWPSVRGLMMIDSASLSARPTSGLVHRAYSVYGQLPVPFPVAWLTFLVNNPRIHCSTYIASTSTLNTG